MKKTNNRKTRKFASALAALSLVSAMAMPMASISASAAEDTAVADEMSEIIAETEEITVNDEESEQEAAEEAAAVTTTFADFSDETEVTTTTETVIADTVRERTEKQKIRQYFNQEFADFNSDEYAGNLDYTQGSNLGVEKRGKNLFITKSEHVNDSQEKERLTLSDTKSTVFPGALVKADDNLANGNPRIIDIERNDMTLRVENGPIAKDSKRSRTVNLSSVSDVKDIMAEIEDQCLDPDTPTPARFNFNLEKINSDEQLKAKAHLEQSVYGKLKLNAECGIGDKKQMVLLDFTQIYYTISADPQTKEKLFGDNVAIEEVQSVINSENPAAFVSGVDYGRRVVACIETDDTSFDLKTELEGSGMQDKIKGNASLSINNKLSTCNVKYYVYGGSGENSGQLVKCTGTDQIAQLLDAISKDMSYKRNIAMPVSYTTNFAHDGVTAKVNFTENYYVNKTEVITPTAVKIESPYMFNGFCGHGCVDTHTVKIVGKKITGLDEYGDFTHGAEETIYQRTFGRKDREDCGFREIPADYDLDTVRVYFDYEGNKKTGFNANENGIRISSLIGNVRDTKNIEICIESGTDYSYIMATWASYTVDGKVKVIDKNGNSKEKTIHDM